VYKGFFVPLMKWSARFSSLITKYFKASAWPAGQANGWANKVPESKSTNAANDFVGAPPDGFVRWEHSEQQQVALISYLDWMPGLILVVRVGAALETISQLVQSIQSCNFIAFCLSRALPDNMHTQTLFTLSSLAKRFGCPTTAPAIL
jgi:hypothetical protein